MDHSIKKKPEKPRICLVERWVWLCHCREIFILGHTRTAAYQHWRLTREARDKYEGKS